MFQTQLVLAAAVGLTAPLHSSTNSSTAEYHENFPALVPAVLQNRNIHILLTDFPPPPVTGISCDLAQTTNPNRLSAEKKEKNCQLSLFLFLVTTRCAAFICWGKPDEPGAKFLIVDRSVELYDLCSQAN